MVRVAVKDLRAAFRRFQQQPDIGALLHAVEALRDRVGGSIEPANGGADKARRLAREKLRLICFDLVTGG